MPEEDGRATSDILSKLAQALTVVSQGDPIVSLRTELASRFSALESRFDAIDKATTLQHEDLTRVPTQVDRAVAGVQSLLESKLQTVSAIIDGELHTKVAMLEGKIEAEIALTGERFAGIASQFAQGATALTAALQAQEKQAIATNDSNKAASDKMEGGFTELIRQQAGILTEVRRNYDAQLTAINSRLDKSEGKNSISDPATTSMLTSMTAAVDRLRSHDERNIGSKTGIAENWGMIMGGISIVVSVVSVIYMVSVVEQAVNRPPQTTTQSRAP